MPTIVSNTANSPVLNAAITAIATALPTQATQDLQRAQAIAAIIQPLGLNDDIVLGALLYPLIEAGWLDETKASALTNELAARIATDSVRLKQFQATGVGEGQTRSSTQAESLRKMLLAIASDARLVFIRLADQLNQLRQAKILPEAEATKLARETREIFAPLANRLGIWQLKWELEDLSFRYLNPEAYKRIATWLASKRADREHYISEVQVELQSALTNAGIHAEIAGRPKHIYSIWRKMQRKGLSFEQIYDIRAVRIMVATIADCYAALGVVHSLWPFIPGEFDDYIATPKDNHYRSIHTAVIGPGKLPLEVQIRTKDMHEHAELGVAAHWRYKEGGRSNPAYEQKIAWLRQILEPAEQAGEKSESEIDFLDRMRVELFEDRVYALSPRGEVVDLPKGATPLDYAYQVHTNLGHRCRGAKVNDQIVPLTYQINNGETIDIITGKHPNPSRDWLSPSLGFLASPRNRSKVRAWFRKQDESQNIVQGRQILERELQRLAAHSVSLPELLNELHLSSTEALYQAIGEGHMTSAQITGAVQRCLHHELEETVIRKPEISEPTTGVRVNGVGELLSNFARCCRPVPPEPIVGYITVGRGISIHRNTCSSFKNLQLKNPQRVIPVDWGGNVGRQFAVDIIITAYDRRGLVRDISAVLADAKLSIQSMNTLTRQDGVADIQLRITVHDLAELSVVLGKIQGLPNIIAARRKS